MPKYVCGGLELFFPHLAVEIDWKRGWEPLDKELRPEKIDDVVGMREPDLLFKVHLRNGEENWIAVHIEFQAQSQDSVVLTERIWVYYVRIRQRYGRKVSSLLILGDLNQATVKPFEEMVLGTRCRLDFPVATLLDIEKELVSKPELSVNPFSWIVRLHLAAKRSSAASPKRRAFKREYLRQFFVALAGGELGTTDQATIRTIHKFYDAILSLSAESDKLFREELSNDEEIQAMLEQHKPGLTMFERWAVEDERQRHEDERQRHKEERQRHEEELEQERRRTELASQRAEQAEQRADKLAAKLAGLGIDPDS